MVCRMIGLIFSGTVYGLQPTAYSLQPTAYSLISAPLDAVRSPSLDCALLIETG